MSINKVLSDDDKHAFIRDGYIVLRNIVPKDMIDAALVAGDEAYNNKEFTLDESKPDAVPNFNSPIQKHPDIGGIVERTKLFPACEDLLGNGNAKCPLSAQVAYRPQNQTCIQQGVKLTDNIPSYRYHVDAANPNYATNATPFTLLVGVCLSFGQDVDESRGQFTVWPGSHLKLHEFLSERAKKGLLGPNKPVFGGKNHKPQIGEPIRVLLYPGDAVLAHQRLGHSGGLNVHNSVRKNLYFRVRHKNHDELIPKIVSGSVFTEFEGLHHLVDGRISN